VWLSPSSPHWQSLLLALFGVYCWAGDLPYGSVSAGTVRSKLSHVRWYHRLYADFDLHLTPNHTLAIADMQRTIGPSKTHEPVTPGMLQWVLEYVDPTKALHRVIGGAAVLGIFFLMRSAEYIAVNGCRRVYTLQVGDVKVSAQQGRTTTIADLAASLEITIRGSKNDQVGAGVTRRLGKSGHATLCPVLAALTRLRHAENICSHQGSPTCLTVPSKMLTAEVMTKVLRHAATAKGVDPSNLSSHSLRSGGENALLASGVDSTMLHRRWKSDVFQRCTRYDPRASSQLARQMARSSSAEVIG